MKKVSKAVVFLGISKIQYESIKSAKKNGFKIIGIDKNNQASGRRLVDFYIKSDCTKINYIANRIKKLKKIEVINIWANNDVLLISKYKLEKKLRIKPENTLEIIKKILNKKALKKEINSRLLMKNSSKFPKIAKPIYGSGSKGIKVIGSLRQLKILSKNNSYVFEDYLKNLKEYGINFYNDGYKIDVLPSVYRYFDHTKTFAPLGTVIAPHNKVLIKSIKKLKELVKTLKIIGKIKIDIGLNKRGLKVLELSTRFHGEIDTGHLYKYINKSCPDYYFSKLSKLEKINTISNNKYFYGYFAAYKNRSIKYFKKITKYQNIKFLKQLRRDNYMRQNINPGELNTSNIYCYFFYKSKKIISDSKFKELSNKINFF